MIVWLDSVPHLLDPGYLIVDPIPLHITSTGLIVPTRFNQLQLLPANPDRLELHTIDSQQKRYRLTFKTSPVDSGQFQKAWDASFDWEMMHYPLVTKATESHQLYLRGGHLQRRSQQQVHREEVPDMELAERIVREFNMDGTVIKKALEILRRRGIYHGSHQSR